MKREFKLAWLNTLAGSHLVPSKLRAKLYRVVGVSVGPGSVILSGVYVGGDQLDIGEHVFINRYCRFDAGAPLFIDDRVFMGYGVTVLTSTHELGTPMQRAGALTRSPTVIGRGAWLGANVSVLPGVRIAPGCIIAAGSVVVADTEADTLYAGVPALAKRSLGPG